MYSLGIYLVTLFAVGAGLMALTFFREQRREKGRMRALRAQRLYRHLYHHLEEAAESPMAEIRIESDGVLVKSFPDERLLCRYAFKQNGMSRRYAGITETTALLLMEDFPILRDPMRYTLHRYRIYRLNGRVEYGFAFLMHPLYKAQILAFRKQTVPVYQ